MAMYVVGGDDAPARRRHARRARHTAAAAGRRARVTGRAAAAQRGAPSPGRAAAVWPRRRDAGRAPTYHDHTYTYHDHAHCDFTDHDHTYYEHTYRGLDAATQAEYLAACASLLGAEAEPTTGAAAGEAEAEAASEAAQVEEWRHALRKLAPPSAGEGPWPSRPEELLGAKVVAGGGGGVGLLEWRLDLREGPDEPQLLLLALRLLTASGVAAAFSLEPQQLLGCLVELRSTYLPNSFHNWRHAMMVTYEALQPQHLPLPQPQPQPRPRPQPGHAQGLPARHQDRPLPHDEPSRRARAPPRRRRPRRRPPRSLQRLRDRL